MYSLSGSLSSEDTDNQSSRGVTSRALTVLLKGSKYLKLYRTKNGNVEHTTEEFERRASDKATPVKSEIVEHHVSPTARLGSLPVDVGLLLGPHGAWPGPWRRS